MTDPRTPRIDGRHPSTMSPEVGPIQAKAKCSATRSTTGEPCGNYPVPGARVCRYHGGRAPQTQAKAAERLVEAEARRTFGRLADHATPVDNPFDALARTVGEVIAWKDFCAGRIEALEHLRSTDEKGAEQIDALVSLFERSLDRSVAALATISKLGIEERLARVSERQADAVVRAVDAALVAAGLSGARVTEARQVVARELRRAS